MLGYASLEPLFGGGGVTITPHRLAIVLLCAAVIGLLVLPGVAAQATTDYDRDGDGLIEVKNLEQLNAIRWDLDGDGAVDDPTASSDTPTIPMPPPKGTPTPTPFLTPLTIWAAPAPVAPAMS